MAETWRITPGKRAALATADLIARPFARLFIPPPKRLEEGIWKILVVEIWNIGDVVIATTALQALRARYPDAWIVFLGKPHAEEILRGSGLVDEVITFDFPWTAETDKYKRSRYDKRAMKSLFRRLREERWRRIVPPSIHARHGRGATAEVQIAVAVEVLGSAGGPPGLIVRRRRAGRSGGSATRSVVERFFSPMR